MIDIVIKAQWHQSDQKNRPKHHGIDTFPRVKNHGLRPDYAAKTPTGQHPRKK